LTRKRRSLHHYSIQDKPQISAVGCAHQHQQSPRAQKFAIYLNFCKLWRSCA
jgi:hypothetical protein